MHLPQPFGRLLQAMRGVRRTAIPHSTRFAPIVLERLEDRCVTASIAGLDTPEASYSALDAWSTESTTSLLDSEPVGDDWLPPIESHPWGESSPPANLDAMPGEDEVWINLRDAPPTPRPPAAEEVAADSLNYLGNLSGGDYTFAPKDAAFGGAEAPQDEAPASVAGQQISVSLSSSGGVATGFVITRTQVSDTPLEVRYTVTAFTASGPVVREGVATIAAGARSVEVAGDPLPTGNANQAEIVRLTLGEQPGYQIGQSSATVFLNPNGQSYSELALLQAYREGQSPEAFRMLVDRHRTTVLRTCHQVLGNWHDAEDICQMVFLTLAQQQVRLQSTLAGWLRTVARNAAIAFLRSRNRRVRHEHRAAKPNLIASEDAAHDQREELDVAMQQMAGPLREAVRLRYLEGWSQREAAQILGCPRGTLAQRAAMGVRYLRGVLSQDGEANEG